MNVTAARLVDSRMTDADRLLIDLTSKLQKLFLGAEDSALPDQMMARGTGIDAIQEVCGIVSTLGHDLIRLGVDMQVRAACLQNEAISRHRTEGNRLADYDLDWDDPKGPPLIDLGQGR